MQDPYTLFTKFIASRGLKNTPQRRTIVDIFFSCDEHLSTEELYDKIRAVDKGIGQATVYRTLKLLVESGLAKELHFGDGSARYEPCMGNSHHDHLICTACGNNIEFMDSTIERLQEELAARHGFKLTSHQMYLYGICPACRTSKNTHPAK